MRNQSPIAGTARALLACGLAALAGASLAQDDGQSETLRPLLRQELPNFPGHTFTSTIVDFGPGVRAAPHTHGDAFVYAYVLKGSVRSQLDNEPAKVYRTGEVWFENPGARHRLTENVSATEPASLLVVFVAPTGAALKTPDKP
jgi:quercetin dioxygenase-like cupin family protein